MKATSGADTEVFGIAKGVHFENDIKMVSQRSLHPLTACCLHIATSYCRLRSQSACSDCTYRVVFLLIAHTFQRVMSV